MHGKLFSAFLFALLLVLRYWQYKSFTDPEAAKQYIQEQGAPIVVKADGLAAGKGVVVAQTVEEAVEAVERMLVGGEFGSAGGVVVVEEFLAGEEASFFAIVDGATALPLASAQDHKAVGDGDTGPNTGGMGAYSPAAGVLTPEMEEYVMRSMIEPTVKGMAAEGCPFTGVLYAGLMLDGKGGVKLLEYNVRFGDPECQVRCCTQCMHASVWSLVNPCGKVPKVPVLAESGLAIFRIG